MADQKVSDLPALNGADVDAADLLYIVDSSAGSAGSKKITVGQYQLAPVSGGTANGVAYLNGSKVVTTGSALVFDGTNFSTTGTATATKLIPTGGAATGNGMYLPAANTLGFSTNGTQAMTLDASGQLSVGAVLAENSTGVYLLPTGEMRVKDGTENGTSQISIYNTNTTNDSEQFFVAMNGADVDIGNRRTDSGGLKLFTSNTERARVTQGGDFLVGTSTTVGAGGITLFNNGSTGFSLVNNNNAAPTGYVFSSFRRSSVEIGSITQNGTTAVLFNTTSDRRLKNNIVPAPSASDVIDAIEIVSHDWKAAPDEHVTYGVIAQDLALVAPQAVLQGDDNEEIERTWGVDYSKLVPILIKEIQSLRARVAALESA